MTIEEIITGLREANDDFDVTVMISDDEKDIRIAFYRNMPNKNPGKHMVRATKAAEVLGPGEFQMTQRLDGRIPIRGFPS